MVNKINKILKPEREFYFIAFVYSICISLFSLVVPISIQSLVNVVNFGQLIQPLVVLTLIVLVLLTLASFFRLMRFRIVENFQRHVYVRLTSNISENLLRVDSIALSKLNLLEKTNRFFDIISIQKNVSFLLTDGITAILQTIVGLLILSFYHPYFLVVDLLIILSFIFIIRVYSPVAIDTSIKESKAKYESASWLEEISRVNRSFRYNSSYLFASSKTDLLIENYLHYRKKHFRVLFKQTVLFLVLYVLLNGLVLGIGGYLVTLEQLTIGQLVAAELIITAILYNFFKSDKFLESFYDLCASVDKVHELISIEQESSSEVLEKSGNLTFKEVSLDSATVLNQKFLKGQSYFLKFKDNQQKYQFVHLLFNAVRTDNGQILYSGKRIADLSFSSIVDKISFVQKNNFFHGTVLENLTLGQNLSVAQIYEVLDIVGASTQADFKEKKLDTIVQPSGYPLSNSTLYKLQLASSLLHGQHAIILTEDFDNLSKRTRAKVYQYIKEQGYLFIYLAVNSKDHGAYDHVIDLSQEQETKQGGQ